MSNLSNSYRQLGPVRFWLIVLGTLTYIGVGAFLAVKLHYPQAYGSTCHSKCFPEDYWFSPMLLRHGSLLEYLLFVWLWLLPALVIGVAIWSRLRKRSRPNDLI